MRATVWSLISTLIQTWKLTAGLRYSHVPVGERHHDVEGGQEQAEVEEGVAVGHGLLFVVHGAAHSVLPGARVVVGGQTLTLLRLHQLVHLRVVGGADAAEGR